MRSFIIVIFYPLLGQIPCLIKREEQVGIQHILEVGPVETLHYGILLGLALLDFRPFYFVLIKPLLEKIRGELRSVISTDSFWLPVLLDDALKIRNHRSCRYRAADVGAQAFPVYWSTMFSVRNFEPFISVSLIKSAASSSFLSNGTWIGLAGLSERFLFSLL